MNRAKNIFLHFFDMHYLREKGVKEWKSAIFREASLATRFAVLFADCIIVPASSYFESPLCREIIDSYSDLHFLGLFKLVGNASNIDEFVSFKTIQYELNESTFSTYKTVEISDINIPFSKRKHSSTTDIADQWKNLLVSKDIKPIFSNSHGIVVPKNIEYLWHETPGNLAGKPFIVDNVFPILFPSQTPNIFAINTLHSFINQYYFNSYTREFQAGVVSDLVRLEPEYQIFEYDVSLPYRYILQELVSKKKLDLITNARPDELINIKESMEWVEILISSFRRKQERHSQLGVIGKQKHNPFGDNQTDRILTQINIRGNFHMGDNYQAGQVGAQGPNAHAHDMSFNQIWNQAKDKFDLPTLAKELQALRNEMQLSAKEAEDFAEIGTVAAAEIEAKKGDGPKALSVLAKTGKWTIGVAEKIGVGVATAAIKTACGF